MYWFRYFVTDIVENVIARSVRDVCEAFSQEK